MALSFQSVTLDGGEQGSDAVLVYRDGRLLAVLTCLSDIHGELQGRWFLEAAFGTLPQPSPATFADLEAFERWVEGAL
jgi:hypothetical protein